MNSTVDKEKEILHSTPSLHHVERRATISSTDRLAIGSEGLTVRIYDSLCSLDKITHSPDLRRTILRAPAFKESANANVYGLGDNGESAEPLNECDDVVAKSEIVPPDGGYGWLVVAASLLNFCIISAHFMCFSLFYPAIATYFDADYGITGWIGSLSQAMTHFPGFFFSGLVHKLGCRKTNIIGAGVSCLGYILSSFCNSIPQLYITYGLIAGAGVGMMFLPNAVIVQRYFSKKRAIASGISLSGLSMGLIIFSFLLQSAIDTYSWKGAMLLSGGVCLHGVVFGMLYRSPPKRKIVSHKMRNMTNNGQVQNEFIKAVSNSKEVSTENYSQSQPDEEKVFIEKDKDKITNPIKTPKQGKSTSSMEKCGHFFSDVIDFSLLKDIPFLLYGIGTLFAFIGMLTFYMHTPSRALFYGVQGQYVAIIPTIIGSCTVTSRVVFSFVANSSCVNRTFQYALGILLGAILEICYTLTTNFVSISIGCMIIGFANGIFLTVQSTVLVDLLSVEKIAKSQALLGLFTGTGALISTPLAGFLYDVTNDYNIPFYINGGIQILGALLIIVIYIMKRDKKKLSNN